MTLEQVLTMLGSGAFSGVVVAYMRHREKMRAMAAQEARDAAEISVIRRREERENTKQVALSEKRRADACEERYERLEMRLDAADAKADAAMASAADYQAQHAACMARADALDERLARLERRSSTPPSELPS